jgi:hypothetical protein
MTSSSSKILLALFALATMTGAASAQQRTFYDAHSNVVGRSATDSSGTVTTTTRAARGSAANPPAATRRPSMTRAVARSASDNDN